MSPEWKPDDGDSTAFLEDIPAEIRRQERWRTILGLVILIALVIAGMVVLSWYLTKTGSHLR